MSKAKVMVLPVEKDIPGVISRVFSEFNVDVRGKTVLIKPNIVSAFSPDSGVTTNPEIIRALVRLCRQQGADKVYVGDNPGGVAANSLETARVAGIVDASEGAFINLSERVTTIPTDSQYVDNFVISSLITEVDFLINVPIFKTHVLTMITGAVKNLFGYIAGANKAQMHLRAPSRRRFSQLLLDIYKIRKPDLNIMDGILAMEGNGPTHGQVRPLGKILASEDAVALDAVMCRMIGVDPMGLPLFKNAVELGLGAAAEAEIEVKGSFEVIPDFTLPTGFTHSTEDQVRALVNISRTVPYVVAETCIQCGDCEENCPAGAIDLDPFPEIAAKKCISCFCCVELCSEGAMKVPDYFGEFEKIF